MIDERSTDDDVRLAALRAMLGDGIRELDAGLGIGIRPKSWSLTPWPRSKRFRSH
jgi:hypothetical protein